jgi:hypothetical protein
MLSVLLVKPWRIQQFQLPHQVSEGSREGHQPLGRRDGSAITAAMASCERNIKVTSTLQYMTRQSCAILKGARCSSQRKAIEDDQGRARFCCCVHWQALMTYVIPTRQGRKQCRHPHHFLLVPAHPIMGDGAISYAMCATIKICPGHGVKLLRRLPCVQKVQASIPARRMVPCFGAMALSLSVLLSGLCPCGASVRGRGFGHFASTKCHPV